MEINIKHLIKKIIEKWYIILIISVLCIAASILITSFITPIYSSTATFYVVNISPADMQYTPASLITANETIAKNYMELITSDYVLDSASQKLSSGYGIDYTPQELRNILQSSQKSGTGIFDIKISNADSYKALKIIEVISEESVVKISEIEKRADPVIVIKHGVEAKEPDSPRVYLNIVVAFIIGVFISIFIILLIELTNTKVKTDIDLKNRYKYPIIGQIPKWTFGDNK